MLRFLTTFPLLVAAFCTGLLTAEELPLQSGPHRDLTFKKISGGVWEITLGEGDPHFWTGIVPSTYDPVQQSVLALEYFAPAGLRSLALRYRVPSGEMAVAQVLPVPLAETWQPLTFDLSQVEVKPAAGRPDMRFHLALDGPAGAQIQIRHLRLREANAEEKSLAANRDKIRVARETEAAAILADLRTEYPATITTVHIGVQEITLIGQAKEALKLIGIPPELVSQQAKSGQALADISPDESGNFRLNLPRVDATTKRDRAVWRWRLVDAQGKWASVAKWPTAYGPAVGRKLAKLKAPHAKGIGGVPQIDRPDHELFDLGVRHGTLNVALNGLIRESSAPGWKPWAFEGLTYYLNERQLQNHDQTLRLLAQHNILVSAILLVGNGRDKDDVPTSTLTHPEAEVRGIYSMPNLTAEKPAQLYSAILHHLAERWSREDGSNGRVSNWIMHNEIDQGGTWTNMGNQPLARYLESYSRSARLMYHTARLFDPHARVFISLTHHWTQKSSGSGTYVVRDLLELFAEMGRAEGDYEWGVAYHPYPRDLRNPDTWKDQDLTEDFDTHYITPKNIQVLPAFLEQPRFLFAGKPRGILLSEQGFNTPTLSLEDQRRQVAGMVYMFRKLSTLKTIEAYHLHRYQDMPVQEGGLRLGIITETGAHKLGWDAYKAIGTSEETPFAQMADEVMRADP